LEPVRRRDCRFALQLYADAPDTKPIVIKNVRANQHCPPQPQPGGRLPVAHLELVRRVIDAHERGDFATVFAAYDPRIEWNIARFAAARTPDQADLISNPCTTDTTAFERSGGRGSRLGLSRRAGLVGPEADVRECSLAVEVGNDSRDHPVANVKHVRAERRGVSELHAVALPVPPKRSSTRTRSSSSSR
jgi:hypothetical protein